MSSLITLTCYNGGVLYTRGTQQEKYKLQKN